MPCREKQQNRLIITATLRHQSVAKLRGQQPSLEENHGLLSKTQKKLSWVFEWTNSISFVWQKLLLFFYTFKTSCREGWKAVFHDQEQDKNLDSHVSCHLPVLILYRLFTLALIWMIPPTAAPWRAGDFLNLTVPKRSSSNRTSDRSSPSLGSRYRCWC